MTNEEYLEHYGVLGMKWGKRKGSSSNSSKSEKAKAKADKKERKRVEKEKKAEAWEKDWDASANKYKKASSHYQKIKKKYKNDKKGLKNELKKEKDKYKAASKQFYKDFDRLTTGRVRKNEKKWADRKERRNKQEAGLSETNQKKLRNQRWLYGKAGRRVTLDRMHTHNATFEEASRRTAGIAVVNAVVGLGVAGILSSTKQ